MTDNSSGLREGQQVEIIAADLPFSLGLHRYDGSTGKILSIGSGTKERTIQVLVTPERPDGVKGKPWVPEYALRATKNSA